MRHSLEFRFFRTVVLITLLAVLTTQVSDQAYAQITPVIGLTPDSGYPIWLTPDQCDYLPLKTNQTSGLDWVMSDTDPGGNIRNWFIIADDISSGGIHLISVAETNTNPILNFHRSNLSPPPPSVSGLPVSPANGYDWESIAVHPWSQSIFLSQEGTKNEIALYFGRITPSDIGLSGSERNRAGKCDILPGYIVDLKKIQLPGWDDYIAPLISDNIGIEGIACSKDRLFIGLESPYSFSDRLIREKSTLMLVYKITLANPGNINECELLRVHDTSEWSATLQCTIETICGLDAIDNNHVAGVDRDNLRMFTLSLDDNGEFLGGRVFYLNCPGPMPLICDECPPIDHNPSLLMPSLESITVVPVTITTPAGIVEKVFSVYMAVDPWGPGWTVSEREWVCQKYNDRLTNLLPALYKFTILEDMMF